ncbi:hypothetical protein LB579_31420 [Mesorhizobium sp. BR1-1-7]|nr:hypothetical protein [Mesorhizobium sp. BR1-1-7]
MGLLDALFGGGSPMQANPNAVPQPFMDRLTSGVGHQGGLLQHMGMGQYGDQPMDNHFGKSGGLLELLRNSTSHGGGASSPQPGQLPGQTPTPTGQDSSNGLAQLLGSILSQVGRN